MRVAVLGSGPSLQEFERLRYAWAIGCNDIWARGVRVEAVACADDFGKVNRTRPGFHQTPEDVPVYVIAPSPEWFRHQVGKREVVPVKTRRWNGQFDISPLDKERPIWHGYHSPFFAACVALRHAGATALDFYGLDGATWAPRHIATIIRELNYLHQWVPVRLASSSELWIKQEHPKCGIGERNRFVPMRADFSTIEH